jgi:hypothetical protein
MHRHNHHSTVRVAYSRKLRPLLREEVLLAGFRFRYEYSTCTRSTHIVICDNTDFTNQQSAYIKGRGPLESPTPAWNW